MKRFHSELSSAWLARQPFMTLRHSGWQDRSEELPPHRGQCNWRIKAFPHSALTLNYRQKEKRNRQMETVRKSYSLEKKNIWMCHSPSHQLATAIGIICTLPILQNYCLVYFVSAQHALMNKCHERLLCTTRPRIYSYKLGKVMGNFVATGERENLKFIGS